MKSIRLLIATVLLLGLARFVEGADRLVLSTESLPNFVFSDDTLSILVSLTLDRDPPPGVTPASTTVRPATVRCRTRLDEWNEEVSVPVYNHLSATAQFSIDFSRLSDSAEVEFHAASDRFGYRNDTKRAVVMDSTGSLEGVHVVYDHMEDADGRRVIVRVPRPGGSAHRRWLPVRTVDNLLASDKGSLLLYGVHYGDNHYAEVFKQAADDRGRQVGVALAVGPDVPVFRLFLLSRSISSVDADAVYIFPGIDDVRLGTPVNDYYMALQAMASTFDTRVDRPRTIALCTPPPSGEPKRAAAYRDAVRRVAVERHLALVDLSRAYDANHKPGILNAYPGHEEQARIVERMLSAGGARLTTAVVIVPASVFLLLSKALFWLWAFSRYRKSV